MDMQIKNAHLEVQKGRLSVTQVAELVISKEKERRHLNAFCRFDPQRLRADAMSIDQRLASGEQLALAGLFLAVKDCIDVAGLPTGAGTAALQSNVASANHPALQRLLDRGAIVAGKTNLHELCFGITSNNAFSGPVRNPYNPDMISGGSSGGTAAAIGAGIVAAGLGTDTGGSCRIPASLCGCFGYRASMTRYPLGGGLALSSTRDTIGPMAVSMDTLRLMDAVMHEGAQLPLSEFSLSGTRLGLDPKVHIEDADPEIRPALDAALKKLEQAGAALVPIDIKDYAEKVGQITFPLVFFETRRELTTYLDNIGLSPERLMEGICSPDVKAVFAGPVFGDQTPSAQDYRHVMEVLRPQLIEQYTALFVEHRLDALVFPTTPIPARGIGQDGTVLYKGRQAPTFPSYIQNCDLIPNVGAGGISLPIGFTSAGLPVGMEVDGRIDDDDALLALAHAVHKAVTGEEPFAGEPA